MTFPYAKLNSPHFVTLKIVYSLIHILESQQKNVVLVEWLVPHTKHPWDLHCVCNVFPFFKVQSPGDYSIVTNSYLCLTKASSLCNPLYFVQFQLQKYVLTKRTFGSGGAVLAIELTLT